MQKPDHKDAVTASVTTGAFSKTVINAAKYAAQWQAKMFYCHFTDAEYEYDELSSSDSDDDTPYGNRRDVYRVSGKSRDDGLELKQVREWIDAFARLEWPSSQDSRFGYCPCSHQMSEWRKSYNLYSCDENKDALEGDSDKYRNCSRDKAPRAQSFKMKAFAAHCKDFSLNRNCPLHFGMYCFLRKIYHNRWPKDMQQRPHIKCIIGKDLKR